jgi:hypothetical protein
LRKKPCLSMAGITRVRQLGPCTRVRLHPPGRRRTSLFHGAPIKTREGGALGRLLFLAADPHSLRGGGGQNWGRRTRTWPRGLLLAEPPPRVTGQPAMETRLWRGRGRWRPKKGIEGGRRGKAFIKMVRMR